MVNKKASLAPVLAVTCATVSAQWLHYPTAGIPRNPDGSPNLAAPAPKTADGRPDLSGLWDAEKNRPCPPGGCPDQEVSQEFMNFGWGLKGGLPYQPWAAELVKARSEQNGKDDPGTKCLPIGFLRLSHTDAFYRKIMQLAGLLLILHERNTSYRQIFLDGRPLPVDPNPSWNGYSIGKWDGDALVVETAGFNGKTWLDQAGHPATEALHVTERFRRPDFGHLNIEVTINDPKAYTKPWTVTEGMRLLADTDLLEFVCTENNRDLPHLVNK